MEIFIEVTAQNTNNKEKIDSLEVILIKIRCLNNLNNISKKTDRLSKINQEIGKIDKLIEDLKNEKNKNLNKNNEKGNILRRHKDRPSCEISTTLHLGGDEWPIFLDPSGADFVIDEFKQTIKPGSPKGVRVDLKVGDMLIYSGCELEHWREPFEGNICSQVFLHYNHANGPFAQTNLFDKRPLLGVPK